MNSMNTCAILGHDPIRFKFGWDEEDETCILMKLLLCAQINEMIAEGVTRFLTACDPGVGLWCGELINEIASVNDNVELHCIQPYEEHATKWPPYLRERYYNVLANCAEVITASPHKSPSAQAEAYLKIIKQSDIVLAVYDPQSIRGDIIDTAMAYAQNQKKPIILVHPDTLKIKNLGFAASTSAPCQ
ncbi:MAG: SLOG family protein [Oscillospiraceae bacterium]